MTRRLQAAALSFVLAAAGSGPASAAEIAGETMGWAWATPFVALLLSIALGPLCFPKLWHRHYGKIAAGWAAAAIVSLAGVYGFQAAFAAFVHAIAGEYISFILLLFALYTVAGGIIITGNLRGTPSLNLALLAFGTAIASIVGTTGAAMILIRPLLRANEARRRNMHVVVFFIILVANVGGALTPLGDPPLFVGFLRGVDFFWTAQHLWLQTAIVAVIVLSLFLVLDTWLYRREPASPAHDPLRLKVLGGANLLLVALIVVLIVLTSNWRTGVAFDVFGTGVPAEQLARNLGLLGIALLSLWLTPDEHRAENGFTWEPIREVAILFAAIFVAIVPVIAMLAARQDGAFAPLLALVTDPDGQPREAAYFWLTGALSAFLDNAPTYLVFFELAGGDPARLMGPYAGTLAAISMGAVYMGALTYIGNAPNLMIYAIAVERGVRMPSFFGYSLLASLILVPIFVLLTLLPISPLLPAS